MFFNEEDATVVLADSDTRIDGNDIPLDAAGDSPAAANVNSEDAGVVDLSFDDLKSQTDATDSVYKDGSINGQLEESEAITVGDGGDDTNTPDKDATAGLKIGEEVENKSIDEVTPNTSMQDAIHDEDVDLDFEELEANSNSSTEGDSYLDPATASDDTPEDVDLNFEELNNQTDQTDTVHEGTDVCPNCGSSPCKCESVAPISFSESQVRVFQRKSGNLIMESDLDAVMQYYNYNLSEGECLELIANRHNISEDSISVIMNEAKPATAFDKTVKKVKKMVSPVDNQIQILLAKKSKMTPEQWKKSGNADKLKTLRAKKVLAK